MTLRPMAKVARQHAEWLTSAGFDYVLVDLSNWPTTDGNCQPDCGPIGTTTVPSNDVEVLRPLEVLAEEWLALRAQGVATREQQIGGSGGSLEPPGPLLEPPGPLLTHLHTVYMDYSECLPTRLNPLAERTCLSQVATPSISVWSESIGLPGGLSPGCAAGEICMAKRGERGYATWRWLFDEFYNNPKFEAIIHRPFDAHGKKLLMLPNSYTPAYNNASFVALLESNGGRNDIKVISMWAMIAQYWTVLGTELHLAERVVAVGPSRGR